ncbi:MAG: T9SS type A sorting domain-containing protein [Saprospiraceae bacterium]
MLRTLLFISILAFPMVFTAQSKHCLPGPDLNFGGTKVFWAHTVEDPDIDSTLCVAIIADYQYADALSTPIEFKNNIITTFYTPPRGSHLYSINKATGEIAYHTTYNTYNTEKGIGYVMKYQKIKDDTLVCIGYEGRPRVMYNDFSNETLYHGFPRLKNYDMNTGEEVYNYAYPYDTTGYYKTHKSEVYPEFWLNDSIIFNMSYSTNFVEKGDSISLRFTPQYVTFPAFDLLNKAEDLPVGTAPPTDIRYLTKFNTLQGKVFSVKGPFSKDNHNLVYFATIEGSKQDYYKRIEFDITGKLIANEDVTDVFCDMGLYDFIGDAREVAPNLIRFYLYTFSGPLPLGHVGYIDIDLEGNCIRSHPKITIGNMKPTWMRTINLRGTNDLLHCMTPWDSKDILFYREDGDTGQFRQVGKLINPNNKSDSNYVFIATHMMQTTEGDLYLQFETRLTLAQDWQFSWLVGGWQQMLLVSGEDLGISVSTGEQSSSPSIGVYPNPSDGIVHLDLGDDHQTATISLLNHQGQLIKNYTWDTHHSTLDISDVPSGIYFIKIGVNNQILYKKVIIH